MSEKNKIFDWKTIPGVSVIKAPLSPAEFWKSFTQNIEEDGSRHNAFLKNFLEELRLAESNKTGIAYKGVDFLMDGDNRTLNYLVPSNKTDDSENKEISEKRPEKENNPNT